ncbi:Hypothetical protein A7982_11881 [Minicystis rosea]|nr:Hypothetical protein A7982_11881 [Minicystis rosea]
MVSVAAGTRMPVAESVAMRRVTADTGSSPVLDAVWTFVPASITAEGRAISRGRASSFGSTRSGRRRSSTARNGSPPLRSVCARWPPAPSRLSSVERNAAGAVSASGAGSFQVRKPSSSTQSTVEPGPVADRAGANRESHNVPRRSTAKTRKARSNHTWERYAHGPTSNAPPAHSTRGSYQSGRRMAESIERRAVW